MTRTPLPTLRVKLCFLTPAFLAGADQAGPPELRIPSLRGALRHWLRAIDPAWSHREHLLFGDTRRQGAVLIQAEPMVAPHPIVWDAHRRSIDRTFQVGRGKDAKNGVKYLGYTLSLGGNERRQAWPAGTVFSLRFTLPDRTVLLPRKDRDAPAGGAGLNLSTNDVQALLGAIWALGNLGALGTRARRGFGSLELGQWSWGPGVPVDWEQARAALPLVDATVPTLDQALERLERGRTVLRDWLGTPQGDVPHLGERARLAVLPAATDRNVPRELVWATPLQAAGLRLQEFRSGREPDRSAAREHVRWMAKRGGRPLALSPQRIAFGLPLTFRFLANPARDVPERWFELNPDRREPHNGKPAQRWPSPLRIKAIQTRQGKAALLVRMDGLLPSEEGTMVRDDSERDARERDARERGTKADKELKPRSPLDKPDRNLLDDFMDEISPAGRRR
jgi:CRISPR type III-B/RAMP module RAMP protein Cmr1